MRDIQDMSVDQKLAFASSLLTNLEPRPFGSLSKTELDASIYDALRSASYVKNSTRIFAEAEKLQVTPTRVNTLRYNSRLRALTPPKPVDGLGQAVAVVLSETGDGVIVLNVEDKYWRDVLIAELKKSGVYLDFSFNRERLVLKDPKHFDDILALFGDESKPLRELMARAQQDAESKTKADFVKDLIRDGAKSGAKYAVATGVVTLRALMLPHGL